MISISGGATFSFFGTATETSVASFPVAETTVGTRIVGTGGRAPAVEPGGPVARGARPTALATTLATPADEPNQTSS